jgi:cell wall-associated NlpC family hydrolase
MELLEFARHAISVPFVERGRSWEGWDCWGLICVAYRELFGFELPDFLDRYKTTHEKRDLFRLRRTFVNEKTMGWSEPSDPAPGDVAIILRQAVPIHIGLLLTPDRILHAENGTGTVHEPLSAFRIEGFYRHVHV